MDGSQQKSLTELSFNFTCHNQNGRSTTPGFTHQNLASHPAVSLCLPLETLLEVAYQQDKIQALANNIPSAA
jgi:hypothetical protein